MGMSLGDGHGSGQTVLSEINVTPFVDVMLVLLVIFMVATPIMHEMEREQREVEMDLPVTRDNPQLLNLDEVDQIILTIDEDLRIFIGSTLLVDCSDAKEGTRPDRFEECFQELQNLIEHNQKLQDDGRLYLLAHREIPYGFVVGSMNRIRLAGVSRVGMVTNPEFQ